MDDITPEEAEFIRQRRQQQQQQQQASQQVLSQQQQQYQPAYDPALYAAVGNAPPPITTYTGRRTPATLSHAMAQMPGMVGRGYQTSPVSTDTNVNQLRTTSAARFRVDRGSGSTRGRQFSTSEHPSQLLQQSGGITSVQLPHAIGQPGIVTQLPSQMLPTQRTRGPAPEQPRASPASFGVIRSQEPARQMKAMTYRIVIIFHHLVCPSL